MNSRTHSDEQVNQIASSIKEFGFTNPILIDEDGGVIAGHGRIEAAKKLSINELPCIILDGLTDAQKKAYVITDNQLALNAGWNEELLKLEIESLKELDFDIDLLGFDEDFITTPNFEEASELDQGSLHELSPNWISCLIAGKSLTHVKNLKVGLASHKAVEYACKNWHYSKTLPVPPLYKVGVWESEVFIGVVVFSRGASSNLHAPYNLKKTQVCELTRVALNKHSSYVSEILAKAVKLLKESSPKLKISCLIR